MFCPNCGREIPEGSVCPCSVGTAQALSTNPAVNVIKTVGSSPLFLVAAILSTAAVALNVASSIIGSTAIFDLLYEITGVPVSAIAGTSAPAVAYGAIVGMIPAILTAIGMWLHYTTCRRTDTGNITVTGLTLCKTSVIINLVVSSATAVLAIGALVVVCAMSQTISYFMMNAFWYLFDSVTDLNDFAMGLAVIAIVLIIFLVVLFFFIITYYILQLKTISHVKVTALTGCPDNRISRFVVVLNFIMAFFAAISGVATLFAVPTAGLASLASAGAYVLTALCMMRTRVQMTELMYTPVQPIYEQPVYAQPVENTAPVDNTIDQ